MDPVLEALWRMHDGIGEWIRTADQKAGIIFALIVGIGALAVTQFIGLSAPLPVVGKALLFVWAFMLLVAAVHAAAALFPRLDTAVQQDSNLLLSLTGKVRRLFQMAIVSVVPRALVPPSWFQPSPPISDDSALFYGTLAHTDPGALLAYYQNMVADNQLFALSVAHQVRALSTIADAKFRHIRYSILWLVLSLVPLGLLEIEVSLAGETSPQEATSAAAQEATSETGCLVPNPWADSSQDTMPNCD